jgi:hypothetical protein
MHGSRFDLIGEGKHVGREPGLNQLFKSHIVRGAKLLRLGDQLRD